MGRYRDIYQDGVGELEEEMGAGYGDEFVDGEVGANPMAYHPSGGRAQPRRGSGQPHIRQRALDHVKDLYQPISKLGVAPGPDVITAKPQKVFRVKRFTVATSIAPFFTIEGLSVGVDPQFTSQGSAPAENFMSTAVGVSLRGSTAVPGIDITANVTNIDIAAHNFLASIVGDAV